MNLTYSGLILKMKLKKLKSCCFQRFQSGKRGNKHTKRKKGLQIQKEEKGTTNAKRQKKNYQS